jgi:peptide/nickel transport system ATP-binding protein
MGKSKNRQGTTKPLLSVENLEVAFDSVNGNVHAVRGMSFSVSEGEIVGIVGESGSGKSVACRSVLGLLPSNASIDGQVLFEGSNIIGQHEDELRKIRGKQISMIFQNPASHLDPLMTNGQQIGEALRYHFNKDSRKARDEGIELLKAVGISDPEQTFDAYPHQLSGGMKQRVLIACAIACKPKLLLADEPTTALDVTVQARILDLLRTLNQERNLSIVLVSHDLGVIAEICQRVVVVHNGVIVEQGKIEDVVSTPKDPYTKMLIDSQPMMKIRARRARSDPESELVPEPAAKSLNLLSVENLCVNFRTSRGLFDFFRHRKTSGLVKAVDGISFKIHQGEIFGIVGESGSGKSTVALAITKLVSPSEGQVHFHDKSIMQLRGNELINYRRSVQMVFQNPYNSLNPRFTVAQTIAEPLLKHGLATKAECADRIDELMELVDLSIDLLHRYPHQLSGGQCQRVGIARALAMKPEFLIADEITSALDVSIQAQILALLERLRDKINLTILYISHDLAVVQMFCHRVAVFRAGRLVEIGPVNEVLTRPKEKYTQILVSSAPQLHFSASLPDH